MSTPILWTEVRVLVPQGWEELVAEQLQQGPCTAAVFGRPNLAAPAPPEGWDYVRTFIPDHADSPELREQLSGAVSSLAARSGAAELGRLELEFKALPAEDYANSWKKSWKPFRVGRLCLLPSWKESTLRPGERRLTIEPGAAFGSGRHATTRTCLRVLAGRIEGGERVLDAGSGSGILSVAATLLDARSALGFDIDINAAVIARDLARDNGVAERCEFRGGGFDVLAETEKDYDVVLANIYSDVIIERAAELRERLSPTGWFAFSGCPVHHLDATRVAILSAGLALDEVKTRGRWTTFVGSRA